ncbi:hypothetical protein AGR7A_Lc10289 [Agrobacterium deltaense NCPPB 1641]|uniref:Uncharacterized protein n=1 Tax=Agrobacterium deltaense NCPPB 1641 TaxID=1183425 RepID=A0A1S7TSK9_9HYPH|nr:hypothetical protein AGR7A_Lc10289 [Agrobacterium deltaense NCPPB 1641]
MLLSVVGTKTATLGHQIKTPAGQSRKRASPKQSQHYTRPFQACVPATGPHQMQTLYLPASIT